MLFLLVKNTPRILTPYILLNRLAHISGFHHLGTAEEHTVEHGKVTPPSGAEYERQLGFHRPNRGRSSHEGE